MSAEPIAVNGSLIEARDLWRTYAMGAEEIHALRGVSFTIAAASVSRSCASPTSRR